MTTNKLTFVPMANQINLKLPVPIKSYFVSEKDHVIFNICAVSFTKWVDLSADGLNADDKAAKAEALCVGPPPWFPFDFSYLNKSMKRQSP